MSLQHYRRLAGAATLLTLCVVVLGAYVRLSDAGLGCPDWPGCYGHLDVPRGERQIAVANTAYPQRPVEVGKAWKEMIHRYAAGALGLMVLALAAIAWRRRRQPQQPRLLPTALVLIVAFQAVLGMWTVTWQLKPLVVTAHLLGGMTTLALLWWLTLRSGGHGDTPGASSGLRFAAALAVVVVAVQIALGGWTSTNYAALACTDFPTCQARWWPEMSFHQAFVLWHGLGINYEFGILDHPERVAIHMVHRLGALVVLLYIGGLSLYLMRLPDTRLRAAGAAMAVLLGAQIALGIGNVLLSLPLPVAVAHNGTAALLLLSVVTLNHLLHPKLIKQAHEYPNPAVQSAPTVA